MKLKKNYSAGKVFVYILLSVLALLVIYPMFWLILNSLKSNKELFTNSLELPSKLLFSNYKKAWNMGISKYFFNSIFVAGCSIIATVFIGACCAYGLTKYEFKAKEVIFYLIIGGLLLSPQVALISLYRILQKLHIYNTYLAMILPYIAFKLPFAIFLMRAYFMSFSRDLEDAAYIDGCSSFGAFIRIVLPISRPILASTAIMTSIFVWNEFLFALVFIEDKKLMTLPIGLSTFRDALSTDWTTMLAGIAIASLPMFILYFSMQKHFVRGLSQGSVKG